MIVQAKGSYITLYIANCQPIIFQKFMKLANFLSMQKFLLGSETGILV